MYPEIGLKRDLQIQRRNRTSFGEKSDLGRTGTKNNRGRRRADGDNENQRRPKLSASYTTPQPSPIMSQKIYKRNFPAGIGLEAACEATQHRSQAPLPIPSPPETVRYQELLSRPKYFTNQVHFSRLILCRIAQPEARVSRSSPSRLRTLSSWATCCTLACWLSPLRGALSSTSARRAAARPSIRA